MTAFSNSQSNEAGKGAAAQPLWDPATSSISQTSSGTAALQSDRQAYKDERWTLHRFHNFHVDDTGEQRATSETNQPSTAQQTDDSNVVTPGAITPININNMPLTILIQVVKGPNFTPLPEIPVVSAHLCDVNTQDKLFSTIKSFPIINEKLDQIYGLNLDDYKEINLLFTDENGTRHITPFDAYLYPTRSGVIDGVGRFILDWKHKIIWNQISDEPACHCSSDCDGRPHDVEILVVLKIEGLIEKCLAHYKENTELKENEQSWKSQGYGKLGELEEKVKTWVTEGQENLVQAEDKVTSLEDEVEDLQRRLEEAGVQLTEGDESSEEDGSVYEP